jgi:hypothetical protein
MDANHAGLVEYDRTQDGDAGAVHLQARPAAERQIARSVNAGAPLGVVGSQA